MTVDSTQIHALSGAYAVDAVDDLERAAFERHLVDCPECRAEVASLREAGALLAEAVAVEPPAALRDRVLAEVATVRPLPPVTAPAQPAPRRRRLPGVLAAAAAAIVVGAVVWQLPWPGELGHSPTRPGTSQTPSATQRVLDAADAESTTLSFPGGATATVTHSDSLGEAVIETSDMPAPPAGKVYQLWLDQPGEGMVSAGVMPVAEDQTLLLVGDAASATGAGITVEPEGGSHEPTSAPIALFDFGRSA